VFSAWRGRRSRSSHDPLHSDDFLDAHFGTALEEWARMGGDPTALEMATERREGARRGTYAPQGPGVMNATAAPSPASGRSVAIRRPG